MRLQCIVRGGTLRNDASFPNFKALAAKLGKQAPAHPLFLIKPGTSIIGPNESIERPTGYGPMNAR